MQRRSDDDPGARLLEAERAVDLAYTDPRRASALLGHLAQAGDPDPEVRAVARRAEGMVASARGDLGAAVVALRDAAAIADRADLPGRAAEARASLSYVLMLTGATIEALAQVDRAASVLRGVRGAQVLMQRALLLTELGRFGEADAGFGAALRALKDAGGSALVEGDVHTNRSVLRTKVRAWREADDDLAHAAVCYRLAGHEGRMALVEHNRASNAVIRGDIPSALAHFDEAERLYFSQDRHPGLVVVDRAEALLSVRLVTEARAAARAAVASFADQRNAIDLVQARLVLAQAALADGDPAEARAEADRARRSAVHQRRKGWAALAGYVALRARWDSGDRGQAMLAAGRRVLRSLDGSGWVVAAADARLIVCRLLLDLDRPVPARQMLAEAAATRRRGPAELRARAWHAEALLRLATDDRRGAAAALRQGMDVLDRFRSSLGATELRAYATSAGAELADLGMGLALESGHAPSVLRWAERWRAGTLLLPSARPPEDGVLASSLAELRSVARQVDEAAAEGGDLKALLARQASLERQVRQRSRHVPGTGDTGPASTAPRDLAAALGPAALAEYVAHGSDLWAVVVAGRRTTLHALGPAAAVTTEIDALRYGLRRLAYGFGSPSSLAAAEAMVDAAARTLDDLLVAPLDIGSDGDGPPLVLVPTGPLHAMPWAALPSCSGRPVSLAPSAALWLRAATAPAPEPGRRVLVAGPGLEHAGAEVTALARRDRAARRFTGRRASVEAVTAALDGAELAHIAAHGRFRADNPMFTALDLADGPLTVLDLERLRRPPRDVVLSACDSALAAVHPGDELIGLAAALLAMGTRSLVAGVTAVPDDASVPLMVALHRRLRRGDRPAAALARAQQETAGSGATQRERVAAAGFVCLGAG